MWRPEDDLECYSPGIIYLPSTPSSFSSSFFLFVTVSHSCPEVTKNASLSVK